MVDSAGTHGMHTGKSPDSRSMRAAKRRGFDLRAIRSRPVELKDFIFFDYIVAMDSMNLGVLVDMSPESELRKLSLMMDHAPNRSETEVPDPYYSGKNGFEHVLDLIEEASLGLLDRICADLEQSGATGATGQSCD